MRDKKKFSLLFAILFPLLISIGFSSWIIIYTIEFQTSYQKQPTSDLFDFKQSVVYNATEQVPYPKEGLTLEGVGIDSSEISYQYKLSTEKNFTSGKPINAGTYDVKITVNGSMDGKYDGTCQVQFTINKKKIKFAESTIPINYGTVESYWSAMGPKIESLIQIVDEKNVQCSELVTGDYSIDGMNNGYYYYGTSSYTKDKLTTENIVGSTYVSTVKLHADIADNYQFMAGNKIIIKYKTALIGNEYYTIEDAITTINNSSGTISLIGNSSAATSYVETCFTKISTADGNPYKTTSFTLNTGNTLLVPYTNSTNAKETYLDGVDAKVNPLNYHVYSVLTIPTGIALNVNGSLVVGGRFCYDQPDASMVLERGVILNNGTINVNSGGSLTSYGYTKGIGTVNLESGSKGTDVIRVYDFPGGNTTTKVMGDTFPMNAWSLNNISCKTYIKNGARFYGYMFIEITGLAAIKADNEYLLIGTTSSSDSNCIFRSTSANSKHILKYAINPRTSVTGFDYNALNNVTGSNQLNGQRTIFEIKGDYSDAELKITVKALIGNQSFKTTTDISLPLSFADIIVKDESNLLIEKSDYLFLPGSQILIENGAIVTVGGDVDLSFATYKLIKDNSCKMIEGQDTTGSVYNFITYCVDKNDAKLIVNGQIIINGRIGGTITSTQTGGSINLTPSGAKTTSSFKSIFHAIGASATGGNNADNMRYSASIDATGIINSINDNFSQGSYYISEYENSTCNWTVATKVTNFKIVFYDGTTQLKTITVGIANASEYKFTGGEFRPTKDFYEFACWTNSSGVNIENTTFTETTINVYASWTEKTYNLEYLYVIENDDGTLTQITAEDSNLNPNLPSNSSFTISKFASGSMTIESHPTYTNMYFNGWYIPKFNITAESMEIIIDEDYKIDYSLSKEYFEYIINYLKENNQDATKIPIVCKFTSYQTYTIKFIDNMDNVDSPADLIIKSNEVVTLPNIYDDFEDNPSKQIYLKYWSLSSNDVNGTYAIGAGATVDNIITLINKYNSTNQTQISILNNVIEIQGVVKTKCSVTYTELNYTGATDSSETLYYKANDVYTLKNYVKDGYYIEGPTVTGTSNSIVNNTLTIGTNDKEITIKIQYYKIVTITLGEIGSYVNSCSIKSDKYYSNGGISTSGTTLSSNGTTFQTIQGATLTIYFKANSYKVVFVTWYRAIYVKDGDNNILFHNDEGTRPDQTKTSTYKVIDNLTINFVNG